MSFRKLYVTWTGAEIKLLFWGAIVIHEWEQDFRCVYVNVIFPNSLIRWRTHPNSRDSAWMAVIRINVYRSYRAETHLGPDGTRLEQNAQARLKSLYIKGCWPICLRKCKEREKQIEDVRWRKRRPWPVPTNQVEQF